MSYCRWSSDNWKSDLYCYESAEGWTTHVAGCRRVGLDTLPPDPMTLLADVLVKKLTNEEWTECYRKHRDALDKCGFEDIELPHAGETFHDPTREAFLERLLSLREIGYHVPAHAIECVNEEIADAAAEERDAG